MSLFFCFEFEFFCKSNFRNKPFVLPEVYMNKKLKIWQTDYQIQSED